MIPALCYGLLAAAWIIDLFTPQLFVAAILLNGPIALSSLALRARLTVVLIVLAEIANVVAGIVNGLQAGGHWDSIAVGDRLLAGASFLLVGILTMRAQESARRAGEALERERQIERERALRFAMERVRATLNLELVLRDAVREALRLTCAVHVGIIVRASALDVPETYELRAGASEVDVRREPLSPERASIVERARAAEAPVTIALGDPMGRMLGEYACVVSLAASGIDAVLAIGWGEHEPSTGDRDAVAVFAENLTIALQQARLFIRLAQQNDEIARQKDELQARSEVIRDIVYALAHDLRTPLAAADVTMSQAMSGAYGELPERYREILQSNLASNADLRRLVETLLLVARYEAGEDSAARAPEAIAPIVERVTHELQPLADAKGIALASNGGACDAVVSVDADELRRALTNLIANAIDATPTGGHVDVAVERHEGMIQTIVRDDGFGVPLERRASLFQRFGGVRSGAGTGLGLYIVRRIAEKYGGNAGFRPREPRGSEFFIDLPEKAIPR